MPDAHALLNPSGAKQRRLCPGSLAMQAFFGKPEKPSKYAAEGTAAHQVGDWCLESGKDAVAFLGRVIEVEGFTFEVDAEMVNYVQLYLDNVRAYADGAAIFSEVRLHHGEMLDMHDNLAWGTSDAVVILHDEVQVHDLKYGKGVPVSPVENDQAIAYALGALRYVDDIVGVDDIERVRIVIHQVRTDAPVLEWVISKDELLKVYAPRLQATEHEAHRLHRLVENSMYLDPEQFLIPGEDQCRFCKAKVNCPSFRRKVSNEIAGDFKVLDEPTPLTQEHIEQGKLRDARLADEMVHPGLGGVDSVREAELALLSAHAKSVPLIRMWCDAIEAELERELMAGAPVPDFKVVQGKRGNREWGDADAAKPLLVDVLKADAWKPAKLVSPSEAEAMLKKTNSEAWEKLQKLITQSEGKPTVAPASDKRPALNITPVADGFTNLDEDLC